MVHRAYWARLAQEGFEPHEKDHPWGFVFGTLDRGVLPRLGQLAETLQTDEQRAAFDQVYVALRGFCVQTQSGMEDLKKMARALNDLEEDTLKNSDAGAFDVEQYKRAAAISKDLESLERPRHDWADYAREGRLLDKEIERVAASERQGIQAEVVDCEVIPTRALPRFTVSEVEQIISSRGRRDLD
jgi:hypothetical protein